MTGLASTAARPRPERSEPGTVAFRAYSGLEGLASVEREWDAALQTLAHPRFPHFFAWFDACARHFLDDPRALRVFVAYDGDSPIGLFPLVARTRRVAAVPVRALELPSNAHVLMCDAVFDARPANARLLASFVDHLRGDAPDGWDALVLPNLLEDSAAWFALSSSPPARLIVEEADPCKYLPIIPYEERLASLPKSFRGVLRRSRAKLGQERGVEFVRARAEEIPRAYAEFLAVEGSGWKGACGSAVNRDERRTTFYGAVARGFAAQGLAEINLLKIGGRTVAAHLCLKVDRCLYVLKVGYDEQHSKLGPGHMLFEHVLQRCAAERDVDAVNLVSEAPWSRLWRSESYSRRTALVFNTTARGLAGYSAMWAKQALRPTVRKLRKALRRAPAAGGAPAVE